MSSLPTVAILCGGLATRLMPVTQTIPKALVEVNGEPFIRIQLRELARQGISKVVLCIGHLGEMIEAEVGAGEAFGLSVEYSHDGDIQLGTGGALRKAMPLLGPEFYVLYGDAYLQVDYRLAFATYRSSGKSALMSVYRNSGKWDSSNVWFEDGRILRYSKAEKTPDMHYIDYGMGLLQTKLLDAYPEDQAFDLAKIYSELAAADDLAALEVHERFYEIGSHEGLEEFRALLEQQSNHA